MKHCASAVYTRLIIYIDGWARGNPWRSGIGVVIKNIDGLLLELRYGYIGIRTSNFSEAIGALRGIQRGIELGAIEINLYMDSLLIVNQLNGKWQIKDANLKKIHSEIQWLLKNWNGALRVRHIRREHNKEADRLSNRAMDEGDSVKLEMPILMT